METSSDVPQQWLEHRLAWKAKPVLRSIYGDFFRRVTAWLVPGFTLELGCGAGNFKEFFPTGVAVDIRPAPWVDAVADAHELPFVDASVSNVVLIDVIHHLAAPRRFLAEAERILAPGGRLVLVEPAITPLSWFFYRYFHPERVDFAVDPLTQFDCEKKDPYDGNQAIPTLLFDKHLDRLRTEMPLLKLRHKSFLSLFAYPLSGGFRPWSLVPESLTTPLLNFEERMLPAIGKWMAFRMFVVLERMGARENEHH